MIALWRRVKTAVGGIGGTEWALLGLESLGVMVSILVAFQLQEWAEDRREDRDRERLLERLFEESEANVEGAIRYHLMMAQEADAARPFARALAKRECPSEEVFENALAVTRYPPLPIQRVVLDELTAGVGLSGLKDRHLARLVGMFQTESEERQAQVGLFRDGAEIRFDETAYVDVHFDPEQDEVVYDTDMDALCADPLVRRKINLAVQNKVRFAVFMRHSAGAALALCEALGERLGKTCSPEVPDELDPDTWADMRRRAGFFREQAR